MANLALGSAEVSLVSPFSTVVFVVLGAEASLVSPFSTVVFVVLGAEASLVSPFSTVVFVSAQLVQFHTRFVHAHKLVKLGPLYGHHKGVL